MEPSKKSKEVEDALEKMCMEFYGRSRIESIRNDICVECGKPAAEFRDDLSRSEYTISGLCQTCQDKMLEARELR